MIAPQTATARWSAWSSTVEVSVVEAGALTLAREVVKQEMAAMDLAASRFRPDSELVRLNALAGTTQTVSPLLAEAVEAALWAAEVTDGAVDPTLGASLAALGYDRDIEQVLHAHGPAGGYESALSPPPRFVGRWQDVEVSGDRLTLPRGVALDLGAVAKALTADRAAAAAARRTGSFVLVSIGGDLATAGAPVPWSVRVCERPGDVAGTLITAYGGGLATSSTLARSWRRAGRTMHHLLDPATGLPAVGPFRTATVAAATCVEANAASTAAVVRGHDARRLLEGWGLPARLVDRSGRAHVVGGWPEEAAA